MQHDKKILAERSGWVVATAVIGWVLTFLGVIISIFIVIASKNAPGFFSTIIASIIWIIIGLPLAIVFTVMTVKIPLVLAEFKDEKIYFYPRKGREIAVAPQEIVFISQKNISGRGITYSSGTLKIELYSQTVKLIYVKELDLVRREIETLKEQAKTNIRAKNYQN